MRQGNTLLVVICGLGLAVAASCSDETEDGGTGGTTSSSGTGGSSTSGTGGDTGGGGSSTSGTGGSSSTSGTAGGGGDAGGGTGGDAGGGTGGGGGGSGNPGVDCDGNTCQQNEVCCFMGQNVSCMDPQQCYGMEIHCDEPADCPGQVCCAQMGQQQVHCVNNCQGQMSTVCYDDNDCQGGQANHCCPLMGNPSLPKTCSFQSC